MTKKELDKFEKELEKRGYRLHMPYNRADRCWFKSFGESKHEEDRSNYQIAFSIWDFSPYADSDVNLKKNPYSASVAILLSRCIDERVDMEVGSVNDNRYKDIDYIERIAESFYQWAEKEIEL